MAEGGGLLEHMSDLAGGGFEPSALAGPVVDFYEKTAEWRMGVSARCVCLPGPSDCSCRHSSHNGSNSSACPLTGSTPATQWRVESPRYGAKMESS